jgi:hypothetical protein
VGLLLAALSAASLWGAVDVLGNVIVETAEYRGTPAATYAAQVGEPLHTKTIALEQEGLAALELTMAIRSPSFDTSNTGGPAVHYNFRTRYAIFDELGKEVVHDSTRVVWNGAIRYQQNMQAESGATEGKVTATTTIGRFEVPASGKVQIRLEVEPDDVYEAQADSVELKVYENVPALKRRSLIGGGLCCISPLLLFAGIVLLCYGPIVITTRTRQSRTPGAPPENYGARP